jgi:tRNA dimethylallyltransferase
VQVYRYLDIGSGKPSKKEMAAARHHLIDIVDPDYRFTAGEYGRRARAVCDEIAGRERFPLFVGGTGLYIDSLFKGISEIPDVDVSVRDELKSEMDEKGLEAMYGMLMECDRDFALKIHPNDRQRILRGLEVFRCHGKPISSFYDGVKGCESEDTLYIGVYLEREVLGEKTGKRIDRMMECGFLDEVKKLRAMGYGPELNSMRSIGYSELNGYIDGKIGLDEAVGLIKSETKKYAKRQMTWFRKNKRVNWFRPDERDLLMEAIKQWMNKTKQEKK